MGLISGLMNFLRGTNAPGVAGTIDELLIRCADLPLDESLPQVIPVLARSEVFLPAANPPQAPDQDGARSLQLIVANDGHGQPWIYAYSNPQRLQRAFPMGVDYVALNFKAVFEMARDNTAMGGLAINMGSDAAFTLPRVLFSDVESRLACL